MKSRLLILGLAVAVFGYQASAQTITVSSPSSQIVNPGNVFNVTIQLSVSSALASNITALNLLLATPGTGSNSGVGFFTVKFGSGSVDFPTSTGNGTTVSDFNTAGTGSNIGFNVSTASNDLGANAGGGAGRAGPFSNVTVDILQFTVAPNTPNGTYDFRATLGSTQRTFLNVANNGGPDTGGTYNINSAPTFSITVVPEPSTWAFLCLGAGGCAGLMVMRRRRTV
ncbi:MAG: PEP-CTERM sorting domain-containing protein [Chthoniobacterales bacterium]